MATLRHRELLPGDDNGHVPPPEDEAIDELKHQLQGVGLSQLEARLYVELLSGPKDRQEMSKALGAPLAELDAAVTNLARRGFVRSFPAKTTTYGLTPPDRALAPQVRGLDRELRDVHELSERLQQLYDAQASSSSKASEERYVEVVFGIDAVVARHDEEVLSAQSEVLAFARPPLLRPGNPVEEQSLDKGVAHRAIYEAEYLDNPVILKEALSFVARGEEARVTQHLPTKMLVIDKRLALVNVTERAPYERIVAGLITRHEEVVETFSLLFETLWERATPLGVELSSPADQDQRSLVTCLLAGMTDDVIAKQLGVSRRTVTRHVHELMRDLGVRTRFQAGFKAAQEAHLREPE